MSSNAKWKHKICFPLKLLTTIISVQFSSVTQSCLTLCDPMNRSTPGLPVHHQLPKFTQTHVHRVGDAIQPSHPLGPLLLLPPIPPSMRVFSNESTLCMRWPKYWSFSFSISPSNEHPGLISFRMDWLDLLTVQGTLKSFLQHSSKATIFQRSAFFTVQLSHPYMTTGKTIALTRWTFDGNVWPQENNREGTQPHPSTENWIKDLLSMVPPIRKCSESESLSVPLFVTP